jgi:hypothetical protein
MLASPALIAIASITAIQPPCGVGTKCDDHAFGLALQQWPQRDDQGREDQRCRDRNDERQQSVVRISILCSICANRSVVRLKQRARRLLAPASAAAEQWA